MPSLVVPAPAKVNLALAVGPPRPGDGFHPICSWFAPISLADELHIERLPAGHASRFAIRWAPDARQTTPINWPLEEDLAVRAHRALVRDSGGELPVALDLIKRTPVGGGLGGGSSDAGAMLRGLVRLFDLDIPADRLRAIALSLGSDVPYFLGDPLQPAIVEGIGETIEPTPPFVCPLVLILPPFGCPTGAVYRAFDAAPAEVFRADDVRRMARAARLDPGVVFNDLAEAAEQVEPRLASVRRRAAEVAGVPVHITGSGSTMFIACNSADRAAALGSRLRQALGDCQIMTAETV